MREEKRNHYLDFLRGVAAVNIIFIHTVFWSGTSYVPTSLQTLSLILDVPFFFFLSGWAFTYTKSFTKSIRTLILTYTKYVFFLAFYILCLFAVAGLTGADQGITAKNLFGNLFFLRFETTALPVVMSSMWFLPVYFWVVPIGNVLLRTAKRIAREEQENEQELYCVLLFVAFMGLLYIYIIGTRANSFQRILFHLFFFLVGANCKDIQIHKTDNMLFFIILDLLLMKGIGRYFGWDISQSMQQMKFPPNIAYLLYSLLSVLVVLWGKRYRINTNNIFCRVGRNAIWFYFSQGISSSLLYFIHLPAELPWYGKLPVMFLINATLCAVFVAGLTYAWEKVEYNGKKLKKFMAQVISPWRN